MRVTRIGATELFSFDAVALTALGPSLTVLVGPNGAGKANLIRIPSCQVGGLAEPRGEPAAGAVHDARRDGGSAADAAVATVGMELTAPREPQLMTQVFRAALLGGLARNANGGQVADTVLPWIDGQVTEDKL